MRPASEKMVLRWLGLVAVTFSGGLVVSEYLGLAGAASTFAGLLPMVIAGFLAFARGERDDDENFTQLNLGGK